MTLNVKVIQEEKRLARKIAKKLKSIGKKISDKLLDNQKSFVQDLFYDVIVDLGLIVDDVAKSSGIVYSLGVATQYRSIKNAGKGNIIDFEKIKTAKEAYIASNVYQNLTTGFTDTTVAHISNIISEGLNTGTSYTTIAKSIMEQTEHGVLSPARAKLIAVNQLASGYELGNKEPYKQLQAVGIGVRKKRLTVGDHKVTPSHTVNQEQGYIGLDELFIGTGDDLPPAWDNPNCRCTTQYEIAGVS